MVGLSSVRNSKLQQLSGGEQQRVAIAIALANKPSLLLADEPTGSVDRKTADVIFDLFRSLNREMNQTIVVVTHDQYLSRLVSRVVAIRDGRTSSEFLMRQSYAERFAEMRAQGLAANDDCNEHSHDELAVLDRNGRLQLPREYLEALGIHGRDMMKVELEEGKIVLLPRKCE